MTIAFLKQHVGPRQSPHVRQQHLPGPPLLANYMPELEAFFHYRNLDVSTLKESPLGKRWKPRPWMVS